MDLRTLTFGLTAIVLACVSATIAAAPRPNVVFILSDNQSYHELGCHGNPIVRTPHIDKLAAQSVDFTQFHTQPFCSPSRAAILSGRHAMRHGVYNTLGGVSMLPNEAVTLAELFGANGYATGMFGKWHLGDTYPTRPQDQGFEVVYSYGGSSPGNLPDTYGNSLFDTTFVENGRRVMTRGFCTDVLFDRALRFIDAHRDRPFFCYIPTPVTHRPWAAPDRAKAHYLEIGMNDNDAAGYAQMTNLDANVGRLLRRLERLGLANDTIVIFMTDQGMGRGAPRGDLSIRYDMRTIDSRGSDWATHVAFMVRYPRRVNKPRRQKTLATAVDLLPTLTEWCALKHDLADKLDGQSLVPLMEDPAHAWPDRVVILQCPRGRKVRKWENAGVKTQRWRLVDGRYLFDAEADRPETVDLAAKHPQVVARLRGAYERWWATLHPPDLPTVRLPLGAAAQPAVRLTAMDWFTGANLYTQASLDGHHRGAWAVRVARSGSYRIELRRYPREADKPHDAVEATLTVGDQSWRQATDATDTNVTFKVELNAGDTELGSTLTDARGRSFSAYYAYVSYAP